MYLMQLVLAFQDLADDMPAEDWLTEVMFGEPRGIDWLYLLIGVSFFCFVGYGIYSAMLHGQVGANRHPANFRKLMIALVILCCIFWFSYAFFHVFGGIVLGVLLTAWLIYFVIFLITRRKIAPSQS